VLRNVDALPRHFPNFIAEFFARYNSIDLQSFQASCPSGEGGEIGNLPTAETEVVEILAMLRPISGKSYYPRIAGKQHIQVKVLRR